MTHATNAQRSEELQELITKWTASLSPEAAKEMRESFEYAYELGFEEGHSEGWDAQAQATPW